jgi:hypothetical protein
MDNGLGGEYKVVHNSLALNMILSQLEPSRFYRIRYAARNIVWDFNNLFECDQLQFSAPLTIHTSVRPSEPRALRHMEEIRFRDALIFEWAAPEDDGSSKLQQYTLELTNLATPEESAVLVNLTVQANQFKFESLTPATDY